MNSGSTHNRRWPVQVSALTQATTVAAGNSHSLAIRHDGSLWAWGSNTYGQLGNGASAYVQSPVRVALP